MSGNSHPPLSQYPGENVNCFNLEFTSLSAMERSEECPNGRSCFQNTTLHPGSWTLIGFRSSGSAQHSPGPVSVMVKPSPVFQTFIELIIRTLTIVRPESGYPSCSLNIRINIENCFTMLYIQSVCNIGETLRHKSKYFQKQSRVSWWRPLGLGEEWAGDIRG